MFLQNQFHGRYISLSHWPGVAQSQFQALHTHTHTHTYAQPLHQEPNYDTFKFCLFCSVGFGTECLSFLLHIHSIHYSIFCASLLLSPFHPVPLFFLSFFFFSFFPREILLAGQPGLLLTQLKTVLIKVFEICAESLWVYMLLDVSSKYGLSATLDIFRGS